MLFVRKLAIFLATILATHPKWANVQRLLIRFFFNLPP
jgi:hypothetical protein